VPNPETDVQKHPIASLPFDKRRLFAHEALAAARVLREAINTSVICEPAKLAALILVFGALGPEDTDVQADFAEATRLIQTLEAELQEPDATLLRTIITSMRANPNEDAMDRGDVITLDAADLADLTNDDRIDQPPRFTTGGSI
jgi:hypothetical protein